MLWETRLNVVAIDFYATHRMVSAMDPCATFHAGDTHILVVGPRRIAGSTSTPRVVDYPVGTEIPVVFRLRANKRNTLREGEGPHKVRTRVRTLDEVKSLFGHEWEQKGYGFVLRPGFSVDREPTRRVKGGEPFDALLVQGTAVVTDVKAFADSLTHGIGRSKKLGFGTLVVNGLH